MELVVSNLALSIDSSGTVCAGTVEAIFDVVARDLENFLLTTLVQVEEEDDDDDTNNKREYRMREEYVGVIEGITTFEYKCNI